MVIALVSCLKFSYIALHISSHGNIFRTLTEIYTYTVQDFVKTSKYLWKKKLNYIHILKNNFHLISTDPNLSKIFKQEPTVTYRKSTPLSDYLLKNDMENQQLHFNAAPFGKCRLCQQINPAKLITNDKLNITKKIKGNRKEREFIYAAQCSNDKILHIGYTGEQPSERIFKHCFDIKNRPDNNELAKS